MAKRVYKKRAAETMAATRLILSMTDEEFDRAAEIAVAKLRQFTEVKGETDG